MEADHHQFECRVTDLLRHLDMGAPSLLAYRLMADTGLEAIKKITQKLKKTIHEMHTGTQPKASFNSRRIPGHRYSTTVKVVKKTSKNDRNAITKMHVLKTFLNEFKKPKINAYRKGKRKIGIVPGFKMPKTDKCWDKYDIFDLCLKSVILMQLLVNEGFFKSEKGVVDHPMDQFGDVMLYYMLVMTLPPDDFLSPFKPVFSARSPI